MSEKITEAIVDFANSIEAACVQLKRYIGEVHGIAAKEETFLSLKWEKRSGDKLKDYEVTSKILNSGNDTFQRCFNILKRNNAVISNRFRESGWGHAYWLYGEYVYRQQLKP